MKKEKQKSLPRKQGGVFIGLWAMSYTALWTILVAWMFLQSNTSAIRGLSVDLAGSFGTLITVGLVSLIQQRLLQRAARGWVLSALLGTLITFGLFNIGVGTLDSTMLLPSLAMLIPSSLAQMVWLRQHVKSAWLWPLANGVAAMSFAFFLRDTAAVGPGVIMLGLLQGIIQAVVIRYLWSQPVEIEVAEQEISVEVQPSQDALERLSVRNPYEDEHADEEPVAQQQSH